MSQLPKAKNARAFYQALTQNKWDVEPDIFHFNFGSFQGKLFLDGHFTPDGEGIAIPYPYQDTRFYFRTRGSGNARRIVSWRVISPDGYTYFFGRSPHAAESEALDVQKILYSGSRSPELQEIPPYTSAWYLVAIFPPEVNPNQIQPYDPYISFEYNSYEYRFSGKRYSESSRYYLRGDPNTCPVGVDQRSTEHIITGSYLKRILYPKGSVRILYQDFPRKDLPPEANDPALKGIALHTLQGEEYKSFEFVTDYFTTQKALVGTPAWKKKRLRLRSVRELDKNKVKTEPYIFSYDTTQALPAINSFAQDHWGFYNGSDENQTLMPRFFYEGRQLTRQYSNRSPNETAMQAGVLKSIQYPTGGRTMFTYEGNRVFMKDFPWEKGGPSEEVYAELHGARNLLATQFDVRGASSDAEYPEKVGAYLNLEFWLSSQGGSCPEPCECTWKILGPESCGIRITILPIDDSTLATITLDGLETLSQLTRQKQAINLFLPNGRYQIQIQNIDRSSHFADQVVCRLSGPPHVKGPITEGTHNKLIGGLRIAQIRHTDPTYPESPDQVHTFSYEDGNKSSGVLISPPIYHHISQFFTDTQPQDNPEKEFSTKTYSCHYLTLTATSQVSLGTAQGQTVGYKKVRKKAYSGDFRQENGWTTFHYYSPQDPYDNQYPFTPAFNQNALKRGQLDSTATYASSSANRSNVSPSLPLQTSKNSYSFTELHRVQGIVAGCLASTSANQCLQPDFDVYSVVSGKNFLQKTVVATRDQLAPQGAILKQQSTFTYKSPAHTQITHHTTLFPDNTRTETHYRYPDEAVPHQSQAVREALIQKNMWVPLEVQQYISVAESSPQLISGKITAYGSFESPSGNFLKPKTIWTRSQNSAPYEKRLELAYDPQSKALAQYQLEGGIPVSFLYGYNYRVPIASIQGVSAKEVQAKLSMAGYGPEALQKLAGTSELMPIIDRLRQLLPSAQVVGFTYTPTLQVESSSQENGLNKYFQYDALGRLNLIIDHNKQVEAAYRYHQAKR